MGSKARWNALAINCVLDDIEENKGGQSKYLHSSCQNRRRSLEPLRQTLEHEFSMEHLTIRSLENLLEKFHTRYWNPYFSKAQYSLFKHGRQCLDVMLNRDLLLRRGGELRFKTELAKDLVVEMRLSNARAFFAYQQRYVSP